MKGLTQMGEARKRREWSTSVGRRSTGCTWSHSDWLLQFNCCSLNRKEITNQSAGDFRTFSYLFKQKRQKEKQNWNLKGRSGACVREWVCACCRACIWQWEWRSLSCQLLFWTAAHFTVAVAVDDDVMEAKTVRKRKTRPTSDPSLAEPSPSAPPIVPPKQQQQQQQQQKTSAQLFSSVLLWADVIMNSTIVRRCSRGRFFIIPILLLLLVKVLL